MENVLFIGGARGTGKSTLCKMLSDEVGLDVISTGNYFNLQYPIGEIKQIMIRDIIERAPLIVDTHYAGFVGDRLDYSFERALFIEELEYLSDNVRLHFVLVDLDPETLVKRKLQDQTKSRDMNFLNTIRDLEYNELYFYEYCQQLKRKGHRLINDYSDKALQQLLQIYREIFEKK